MILTKGELYELEKEVEQAEEIIELCTPGFDDDVLDYWCNRLDVICDILEKSLEAIEHEKV